MTAIRSLSSLLFAAVILELLVVTAGAQQPALEYFKIEKNTFCCPSQLAGNQTFANDFHFEIAAPNGFSDVSSSDVNSDGTPNPWPGIKFKGGTADFTGKNVEPAAPVPPSKEGMLYTTVSFKGQGTGTPLSPMGYFTLNGQKVSATAASQYPNGTNVAFVPTPGGGLDFTLLVGNNFPSPLVGSIAVAVNSGFHSHFTLSDFGQPRNERILFSNPEYIMNAGQSLAPIRGHLNSLDEYLLITGTAGSESMQPTPFALALSAPFVPGDADLDGRVDFIDLLTVARNYGRTNATWEEGDFNSDGTVGFDDLVTLARNYGQTLSADQLAQLDPAFRGDVERAFAEVPEPSSFYLLPITVATMLRGRRR